MSGKRGSRRLDGGGLLHEATGSPDGDDEAEEAGDIPQTGPATPGDEVYHNAMPIPYTHKREGAVVRALPRCVLYILSSIVCV